MINRRRGEISARLDGKDYRLCLTLGALAELEAAFETQDINALIERFSTGRLSARDMTAVIGAGLRGGGNELNDEQVRTMQSEDGAVGFAQIVAELLAVTFGEASGEAQGAANP
jgi:hypothetical protein